MNRPTHLPRRQPVGCFALLTAIADALDLPHPAQGDETYLATRSARADLAVAAIRRALREPGNQAAMTTIADLLQIQVSGIDAAGPQIAGAESAAS
jgi:hypothetical protein